MSGGFNNISNNFKDFKIKKPEFYKKVTEKCGDPACELFYCLENMTDCPDNLYRYSDDNISFIKMSPELTDNIIQYTNDINIKYNLTEKTGFCVTSAKKEDNKENRITVKYKNHKIIQSGFGTVGKTKPSTKIQEYTSCNIWNTCVCKSQTLTVLTYKDIKTITDEVAKQENCYFDSSWILSYFKQINGCITYCTANNINPSDMKMIHYDDYTSYSKMAKHYAKTVNSQYTEKNNYKKDNIDPTDVILVNMQHYDYINNNLKYIYKISDSNTAKSYFIENIVDKKLIIPIALKKIADNKDTADLDVFNLNENHINKVTSYEIVQHKSEDADMKSIQINCYGNFNIMSITDENIPIRVTLRSYGYKTNNDYNIGMDSTVIYNGEPTLGKCAVRVWKSIFNIDSDNLQENINTVYKYITTQPHDKVCDALTYIIKSSVKEGEHCLPFLLIH